MKIISKSLDLSREEYFKKHLLIINPLLPVQLTDKEAEVIAAFMTIEYELGKFTFDTTSNEEVRKMLNLSHGGLGNYIRILQDKGFLLEENDELSILEILKPEKDIQGYQFKLTVK